MLKHIREAIRLSGIPVGQIECRNRNGHIHLVYNGRTVVCGSSPSDRDVSARQTAKISNALLIDAMLYKLSKKGTT